MSKGTLRTEMRDGPYGRRNWCLIHETWWKLCTCPGEASMTVKLDQSTIDATRPSRDAYKRLGE